MTSTARTLYLVRHAATEREHAWLGHSEDQLSTEGRRQAQRLAQALGGVGADAIFSSDLARARQTAESIAAPGGLTPILVPGLRERDFGQWHGLTWDEISARFPRESDAYMGDWISVAPPGGETVDAMRARVLGAWAEIQAGAWTCAVVVGHGGTNRILLSAFLGMPLAHLFRIAQDYAAINRIDLVDEVPCIASLNQRLD